MWCAKNSLPRDAWGVITLGVVACAALFIGCGKNRVVLDVDVRSFMDDAQTSGDYQAPSILPVTLRLPAVQVNLVEGFKDFGEAEEVGVDLAVRFDNQTGAGQGQFKVYFGADSTSAYSSPPVATIDATLSPGASTTGTAHIDGDARVRDLFTGKEMVMGVEFVWQPTAVGMLQGTYSISQIQAHIVSTMDLFH